LSGPAARNATAQQPIRVFVVDDHAVVRRGMEVYLEMVDDLEVVGEAADGRRRWTGSPRWPRPDSLRMW
jgi:DNA-binding NarL/FixJ family response regulator